MELKIKRIYEKPDSNDGTRILVDRLWPRGFTKEKAHIDIWLKDIAPTTELRKWFGHDPARWKEFMEKYFLELQENTIQSEIIIEQLKYNTVTLLYGAKDETHNEAVVILEFFSQRPK